ncbi:(2Fe-2S) ferredoxin domain-containing protein [Pseudothauera rhizosphaerae]|uniref:(2Fe-2S) ferredoxin domain-containing protein n=1 Tax=Pseudothauera rhizosphaerae TaxID=2565932 RepID=A0A4S4AJ72_9RHOO|nr:(2Fe-2S) ferredoxin domain-containing protein [Pseudothauera rhizosphaerae]THF59360.1 (2Fe-2S) ferredoxin domain-containing protein [Pseudothauera rhizosphaerae]
MPKPKKHVLVCVQGRPPGHPRGSCQQKGCSEVYQAFLETFQARNLWNEYAVTNTGCLGPCGTGPSVLVYPEGVMYAGVTAGDVGAIIDEHLIGGSPVARLQAPAEVW